MSFNLSDSSSPFSPNNLVAMEGSSDNYGMFIDIRMTSRTFQGFPGLVSQSYRKQIGKHA